MKNQLKKFRQNHNQTQSELAKVMAVSRQTINAIEGDHYQPSLELALKLARYYQVHVDDLFFLEDLGPNCAPPLR